MSNLSTTFMGLSLTSPVVVSSNPLSESIDNVKRMEEAGAGAVILPSLFEEQIKIEDMGLHRRLKEDPEATPEVLRQVPTFDRTARGASGYLAHVYQLKRQTNLPIIGSLNGTSRGGWLRYARLLEAVGVDALELNVYHIPTEFYLTSEMVEAQYANLVKAVVADVNVPVAVKLNPYFTALPNVAQRLVEAGAAGLVLFNRFYQPDFDLATLEVVPNLVLSRPEELRLRLRWSAILYGRISADIAITGGVGSADDVVKALLAGARVVTVASAVLRHGPGAVAEMVDGLRAWLDEREYDSADAVRGLLSMQREKHAGAIMRANYMKELDSYSDGDA